VRCLSYGRCGDRSPSSLRSSPHTNTRAGSQRTRLYFVSLTTLQGKNPRRSVTLPCHLKGKQGRLKALIDRWRCALPALRNLLACDLLTQPFPVGPRIRLLFPVALSGRRRLAHLRTTADVGDHRPGSNNPPAYPPAAQKAPRPRDVTEGPGLFCIRPSRPRGATAAGTWPRYLSTVRPRPPVRERASTDVWHFRPGQRSQRLRHLRLGVMERPTTNPKTVVPVVVVGIVVPVAVGAAGVPRIVVEGAAAQHPGAPFGPPHHPQVVGVL
jgi:hypothetical protein